LCRLLNEPRSNLRYVPLLFLAWANLHGGWVVGLGVLGVWSAASMLSPTTRRQPPLTLLAIVALAALATLLNPYGTGLWRFILQAFPLRRLDVLAWQPLGRGPWLIFTMWSSGAAFIGWTLIRRPPPPIPALAAGLMLAGESLFLIRLVPLFVAAAVTLLAPL